MRVGVVRGLAAAGALFLAVSAGAQSGYGRGGGGGRRGGMRGQFGGPGGQFGGPGGMMGRGGQMRGSNHDPMVSHVMELIYRPEVQTELHLTLKQKNALTQYQTEAQQAVRDKMQQMFQNMGLGRRGQRGGGQNQDPNAQNDPAAQQQQRQQQMQQIQEQRQQIQDQVNKGLFEIINQDQAKRLHELDLQWRGPLSIAEQKVAEEVQVSQEHKNAVNNLVNDYKAKASEARQQMLQNMRAARQNNQDGNLNNQPNPFQAIQKADDDARKEAEEKVLPLLSAEEKGRWNTAIGKLFTFRKDSPMGG